MADPTTNFGWDLPADGDSDWGNTLNGIFQDIDDDLKVVADAVDALEAEVRYVGLPIGAVGTSLVVGDKQQWFKVPAGWAGRNIVSVEADVSVAPTGASLILQLRNVTQGADILTDPMTIEATETSTDTATTAPSIDTDEDDLQEGDIIAADIDQVGSTEPGEDALITIGAL